MQERRDRLNIAVFCSGSGSNFQAIADASKRGAFEAKIALMVCDNPNAHAVKRAKKEGIRVFLADINGFPSKKKFEESILRELDKEDIGLICLAGYMRLLSPAFVSRYRQKIINIHPALLPSFKGTSAIKDALDYGVKVTGVTVHFVNEEVDAGPVIMQEAVRIEDNDTPETLERKIHTVEHRLYPEAVRLFLEGRLKLIGQRVQTEKRQERDA